MLFGSACITGLLVILKTRESEMLNNGFSEGVVGGLWGGGKKREKDGAESSG